MLREIRGMATISGHTNSEHMTSNEKIKPLAQLAELIRMLREEGGKTVVHCHGVFDLLHIGHIRHLEQAKRMGDVLVVTLTPDRYVDKGPHRPAFTETLRAEALASLSCVDHVAINEWPTAEETLRLLRPHYYVKGSEFKIVSSDMTGKIGREEQTAAEIGTTVAFTEDIVFSSSNLINRYLSNLPTEIDQYLRLFRQRFTVEDVVEVIDRMASMRVLVVGDTILDDYVYCEALGKSSKDPVLAMRYQSNDLFAGGVLAVANHVAGFAREVQLVTVIGEIDSHVDFIKSQLLPNVSLRYAVHPKAPTLIKRRFIDGYSVNKLFEVYIMDSSGLPGPLDQDFQEWLREHCRDYDLVIAADFGHGAISQATADVLSDHARFLAVNTQANAGNRGFHTVTRYKRADYACIAEHELRLETRELRGPIRPLVDSIIERTGFDTMAVTLGRRGCIVGSRGGEFVGVPAFALRIVDRVGAGDAFLSVTSLVAAQAAENEILGFIGNVAGGIAVEIVGNMKPVDKLSVKKFVTSLMK